MTLISRLKLDLARLAAVGLLGLAPLAAHAQSFSADVMYSAGLARPGAPSAPAARTPREPSKLYVSKDRLRLEMNGITGTVLLVNGGEGTAFAVFPSRKAYQPLVGPPSEYFWVENAADACSSWQKVMTQRITCEKAGAEEVAGRQTVKYVGKNAAGAPIAAVWIDSALKFSIKWQNVDAGAELRDIKLAQQAEELFSVPSEYSLLTPLKSKTKGFGQKSH